MSPLPDMRDGSSRTIRAKFLLDIYRLCVWWNYLCCPLCFGARGLTGAAECCHRNILMCSHVWDHLVPPRLDLGWKNKKKAGPVWSGLAKLYRLGKISSSFSPLEQTFSLRCWMSRIFISKLKLEQDNKIWCLWAAAEVIQLQYKAAGITAGSTVRPISFRSVFVQLG